MGRDRRALIQVKDVWHLPHQGRQMAASVAVHPLGEPGTIRGRMQRTARELDG